MVNARLGWAFRRVDVSLYARNLFDEKYLDYHDSNPALGALHTYIPGDPREIGLTISANLRATQPSATTTQAPKIQANIAPGLQFIHAQSGL